MIIKLFTRPIFFLTRLAFRILFRYYQLFIGILIGLGIVWGGHSGLKYTSTDEFCGVCHVHPHVTYSWKKSTHYKNESGIVIHCVDCHLPPPGISYVTEKARLGIRDAYGYLFKDTENIDWDRKSTREYAVHYMYDASCMKCHQDLYSLNLEPKGVEAHEYYMQNTDKISCISCHLTVGHYRDEDVEEIDYLADEDTIVRPDRPIDADDFITYRQTIPGTDVTFDMIAVDGGDFTMGSPESEPTRNPDEGPERKVKVSSFWMGEIEVSWREFDVFYQQTATRGKNEQGLKQDIAVTVTDAAADTVSVDAISGPTPPYGSPDQGWGRGLRPAITMTHYAAMKYCEWLSKVTGKTFRLPTEAEWEYACRGGTSGPYFIEGNPSHLTRQSALNRLFRKDTTAIDSVAWSMTNSDFKTNRPFTNSPNPLGLYNMLGNVREFCIDYYSQDAYSGTTSGETVVNPQGPPSGKDHVIRGGSFNSDPADLRSARRDHTQHDRWFKTDPQSPKSVWWYSDCKDVGFRVVRVVDTASE
ncbi:SUMF1/EgtB/PvdO family nonheme iron enzyme [Candidatus Latescibacterota bacterium]